MQPQSSRSSKNLQQYAAFNADLEPFEPRDTHTQYHISSHIIAHPGHPGNTSQQDETSLEQQELIHWISLTILTFHSLDIFNH